MQPNATDPDLGANPNRVFKGHDVLRRPERCPVCGCPTDLFMTGVRTRGPDSVWTWRRPHPRCVLAVLRREARLIAWYGHYVRTRPEPAVAAAEAFDPGPTRFSPALAGLDDEVLLALDCHRSGDFGAFGRIDDPDPEDLDPWCEGLFGVSVRNRLAVLGLGGLVVSRFPPDQLKVDLKLVRSPDVAILTAIDGP